MRQAQASAQTVYAMRFDVLIIAQFGKARIGHTDFLTLVNKRRALLEIKHGGKHRRRLKTIVFGIAETVYYPRLVMVFPVQGIPAFSVDGILPLGQSIHQSSRFVRSEEPFENIVSAHVIKLEHHRQFLIVEADIRQRIFRFQKNRFADGKRIILIEYFFSVLLGIYGFADR